VKAGYKGAQGPVKITKKINLRKAILCEIEG
jgi:hypothetical protein